PLVLGDEDGAVERRALDLDEGVRAWLGADFAGGRKELGGGFRERFCGGIVAERRGDDRPIVVGENRRFDLRGDLGEIGESLRRVHAGGSYHRPEASPSRARPTHRRACIASSPSSSQTVERISRR